MREARQDSLQAVGGLSAALVLSTFLTLSPTGAIAQQGANNAADPRVSHRIPPIDIFIYADQSRSVFTGEVGSRPADKLIAMIKRAIGNRIDPETGRLVLDGDGRLFLYGFGDTDVANEKANDCKDDTRRLLDSATARNRQRLDQGFALYSQTPGSGKGRFKATNFRCLLDHIIANEELAKTVAADRQAMVLIASDFLHDPFDSASIKPPLSGNQKASIASGVIDPDRGICDLQEQYKAARLPEEFDTRIARIAKLSDSANRFPPIFATLELKLTQNDFAKAGNYSRCAIETTQSGAFVGLLAPGLKAERFEFGKLTDQTFADRFRDTLLARTADRLTITQLNLRLIGGAAEITGSLSNPSRLSARTTGIEARTPGGRWKLLESLDLVVPPGATGTIPITAFRPREADSGPQDFRISYRLENLQDRVLSTPNFTATPSRIEPLQVTSNDTRYRSPSRVTTNLKLETRLDRPMRIQGIAIRQPGVPPTNLDIAALAQSELSQDRPIEHEVDIPAQLVTLLAREGAPPLRLSVTARIAGDSEAVILAETVIAPLGGRPSAPSLTGFVAERQSYSHTESEIRMSVSNPNGFPVSLTRCEFTIEGQRPVGMTPSQRTIGASETTSITFDQASSRTMRNALGNRKKVFGLCNGDASLPRPPTAIALKPRVLSGEAPFVCPSADNRESYKWRFSPQQGASLELYFREKAPGPYEVAIDTFQINNQPKSEAGTWSNMSDGRKRFEIPFHVPGLREIKYESQSSIEFAFFASETAACDEPVLIPAHEAGEPLDFQVDRRSWDTEGTTGENLWLLFKAFHRSETSWHRLDKVRIVGRNPGDKSYDVEFRIEEGGLDASVRQGPDERYFEPGDSPANHRTVRLNLTGAGLELKNLTNKYVSLYSEPHHLRRLREPRPLKIEIDHPPVIVGQAQWVESRAALDVSLVSERSANIRSLTISNNQDADVPGYRSASIPLSKPQTLHPGKPAELSATLPEDLFAGEEDLFRSPSLYICAPRTGSSERDCQQSYALGPMPATAVSLSVRDEGYDPDSQQFSLSIANNGAYPDSVTALRLAGSRELKLETPLYVPPGRSRDFDVQVGDVETQSFIVDQLVLDIDAITRRNAATTTPVELKAVPPEVRVGNARLHQIDPSAEVLISTLAWLANRIPWVDSSQLTPNPPMFTADVTVSRPRGDLQGLQARVGLVGGADEFEAGLTAIRPLDGGRHRTDNGSHFEVAITADDRVFQNGARFRVAVFRPDDPKKDLLAQQQIVPITYQTGATLQSFFLLFLFILTLSGCLLMLAVHARWIDADTFTYGVPRDLRRTFYWLLGLLLIGTLLLLTILIPLKDTLDPETVSLLVRAAVGLDGSAALTLLIAAAKRMVDQKSRGRTDSNSRGRYVDAVSRQRSLFSWGLGIALAAALCLVVWLGLGRGGLGETHACDLTADHVRITNTGGCA